MPPNPPQLLVSIDCDSESFHLLALCDRSRSLRGCVYPCYCVEPLPCAVCYCLLTRKYILSPSIAGYGAALTAEDWDAVDEQLLAGVERLVRGGADFLALASNTAHIAAPAIERRFPQVRSSGIIIITLLLLRSWPCASCNVLPLVLCLLLLTLPACPAGSPASHRRRDRRRVPPPFRADGGPHRYIHQDPSLCC